MANAGIVSLVGSGPGDPELITLRGMDRLRRADVVVCDDLAGKDLLSHCRPDCLILPVGKRGGNRSTAQTEIISLLIAHGNAGRRVVRLKGGDPFIFGRGGEEVAALAEAGIAWEVVPGVTSAAAAGASAGVPLTHRGLASAVVFLAGHEDPSKSGPLIDWAAYARLKATLCIYMGARRLGFIANELLRAGMAADTPVALVSHASRPDEKVQFSTLQALAGSEPDESLSPAVAIIGEVAGEPARIRAVVAALPKA
jgi:uroporphyrin-III C-methyltransferase